MLAPPAIAEFPAMLSPCALTPDGVPGTWLIAETRPRNEKALTQDLTNDTDFGFFLPIAKRVSKTRYRQRIVNYVPLIGGYVFCASTEPKPADRRGEWLPPKLADYLLDHNAVFDLIAVHPAAQEQLRREMTELYGAIVSNPNLGTAFAVRGRKCRVVAGPWQGKEGVIDDASGKGFVMLIITTLGQRVPLEIDVGLLEPV